MAEKVQSTKRVLIDKANTNMMLVIAATSFVVIFSLIGCKSLLSQSSYQLKIVKSKSTALKQLRENNKNIVDLVGSYKAFAETSVNLFGTDPKSTSPTGGDNPSLVLDALPSKYDFPGLISSLEKVLKDGGYGINALGGTDDEVAQAEAATSGAAPQPVEIPIPIGITSDYQGTQDLLLTLERSIRPFYVDQMIILATSDSELRTEITAKTFYQPEKILKIEKTVVK